VCSFIHENLTWLQFRPEKISCQEHYLFTSFVTPFHDTGGSRGKIFFRHRGTRCDDTTPTPAKNTSTVSATPQDDRERTLRNEKEKEKEIEKEKAKTPTSTLD